MSEEKTHIPVKIPDGLEYWEAHSVAECLPYGEFLPKACDGDALYRKLWDFQNNADNPTPRGGDGTNGTCETPDGQMDLDNGDKTRAWWGKLHMYEQQAIATAFVAEMGEHYVDLNE